jgi:hypothetical protein
MYIIYIYLGKIRVQRYFKKEPGYYHLRNEDNPYESDYCIRSENVLHDGPLPDLKRQYPEFFI